MKIIRSQLHYLLLFVFLLAPTHAIFGQKSGASNATRTFQLASVGVQSRDFRYISPQTESPFYLNVRPGLIAGPYQLAKNSLPIFKLAPDGTRTPAAFAHIPSSIDSPLVVIVPGPALGPNETILPHGTIVLDYSLEKAQVNSICFLNISSVQVAVAFGKTPPFSIPPGEQNTVSFTPPPPDDCYIPLKLAFTQNGKNWNRIPVGHTDDDIALDENLRLLVILKPDATKSDGGGSAAFTIITTQAPPPS